MADFNQAISVILKHEGGYCNVPGDSGGATNWGISARFIDEQHLAQKYGLAVGADGRVTEEAIHALTQEAAKAIYRTEWWDAYGYGRVSSQVVATKIFDMCVNMGPKAHILVQRALNDLGAKLPVTGYFGPMTVGVLNSMAPANIVAALKSESADMYRLIVQKNPSQAKFLNGWLARADWPATIPADGGQMLA